MTDKIVLDGISFVASGRDYYYNARTRQYLHRYIWEKENGKIPDRHEIHHIDKNKKNNDISNLKMLSVEEHRELHSNGLTDEDRARLRSNLLKNAIPAAAEWHRSEPGREWHKEHYENTKHLLHKTVEDKCIQCKNDFKKGSNGRNKFCSNKCKTRYRALTGVDDVTRTCVNCSSEFKINKYSKTKNCSKKCAAQFRLKDSPN